jgi:hypothetical protein
MRNRGFDLLRPSLFLTKRSTRMGDTVGAPELRVGVQFFEVASVPGQLNRLLCCTTNDAVRDFPDLGRTVASPLPFGRCRGRKMRIHFCDSRVMFDH